MKTDFVLIDYENVQPDRVDELKEPTCRLMVFIGPNQSKIPTPFAISMQQLGDRAEYLLLEKGGKNALDFHIAYYLGQLSTKFPEARFYVISKDNDYAPLLSFLKGKKLTARRCVSIEDLPFLKSPAIAASEVNKGSGQGTANLAKRPAIPGPEVNQAVESLKKMKKAKPKSDKTLRSTLHTVFKKELTEPQMDRLVDLLVQRGTLKIDESKVSYSAKTFPV